MSQRFGESDPVLRFSALIQDELYPEKNWKMPESWDELAQFPDELPGQTPEQEAG